MFEWLFGRSWKRQDVIDAYLDEVPIDELRRLNDLALHFIFRHRSKDWHLYEEIAVSVIAYVHGRMEEATTVEARTAIRVKIRPKILKVMLSLKDYSTEVTFQSRLKDLYVDARRDPDPDFMLAYRIQDLEDRFRNPKAFRSA